MNKQERERFEKVLQDFARTPPGVHGDPGMRCILLAFAFLISFVGGYGGLWYVHGWQTSLSMLGIQVVAHMFVEWSKRY